MANRDRFTVEEWMLLRVTPLFVSVGVSAADASGLVDSIKEAVAGAREMAAAFNECRELELFASLSADRTFPELPDVEALLGDGSNKQQMRNFKNAALQRVKDAVALVEARGSPVELAAYRGVLIRVAEQSARAAKEGGFLGIGGVRISPKERAFIMKVSEAAGIE